jgi:hypothetical protein
MSGKSGLSLSASANERNGAANGFALTDEGRALLESLMMRAATRG